MARTLKTAPQVEAQNDTIQPKASSAELNRRRHMAINSLRKRGIEFPEGFEDLYVLVSITESAYFKHSNGTLTTEEAGKAIDDAVTRHREGYDPLSNRSLL